MGSEKHRRGWQQAARTFAIVALHRSRGKPRWLPSGAVRVWESDRYNGPQTFETWALWRRASCGGGSGGRDACWLCGRPTGKTIVWHHPVPKSRGGRDVVPMHPICQQTLIANFTNSELQRYGMDVEVLLANPNVRKFVDWVANKDPDFTATTARKQR